MSNDRQANETNKDGEDGEEDRGGTEMEAYSRRDIYEPPLRRTEPDNRLAFVVL